MFLMGWHQALVDLKAVPALYPCVFHLVHHKTSLLTEDEENVCGGRDGHSDSRYGRGGVNYLQR